jgi:dolichyl-phosphate-mannose-protein mannosyltransferase
MMTSNNALVPDPDKEDILASKPLDWPFLYLGLRMCGWGNDQYKYYLLGTPVIWWSTTLSLFVAVISLGVYFLRAQRKYVDMDARESLVAFKVSWLYSSQVNGAISCMFSRLPALAGSSILVRLFFSTSACVVNTVNYPVPFLIMGRVTYLHHYVRTFLVSLSEKCD